MLAHLLAAAVGIWLMAAPGVLDYGGRAAAVDRIVGPLIASFGLIAAWGVTRSIRWINVALAALLLVAPLFLGYPRAAVLSSAAAGVIVAALSLVRGRTRHPYGGGWRSLRRARAGRG